VNATPFAHLLRPELAELASYVPQAPPPGAVRLDANEAPPLLSEAARVALARAMMPEEPSRYPDACALELRRALAAASGAEVEEVLVGVGSDEIIALLLTALDRPRRGLPATSVLTPSPTFVMYRLSARSRGLKMVEVPLDASWDLDVANMRRAVELTRPNVVFVATPNNPTGNMVSADRLQALVEAASDALVVIDEAYIDYAPRDQMGLLRRFPNVAVLRTLSKIGLAALRIGWLVGPAGLVREVDKVRQPYNLCVPAQRGAVFALRELRAEIDAGLARVRQERARVREEMLGMGHDVPESHANFLWVGTPRPAGEVHAALAERGVLVRSFHAAGGRLAHRLRITIGLPADNDRLLEAVRACG
jgi:histidinol-phosphate aminotransferase